ncbi:MAG: ribosome biogenesis GTP-binding protein YihA/YsxC [Candidatus Onthovivens sp.]|nr:ribosome biogenesis GTP-binding protein YihA/YsxC [Candidatus Onthovivens sp.]
MTYFKKAKFIKSVADVKDKPQERLNEVLFVGKSNVGKSSLINMLTNNSKLAFTSSKPGHTKLLNYYLIEDYFYFVDCPGYGYSSKKDVDYKFFGDLVENYFTNNHELKLILFLLDSRHLPSNDDIDFFNFLQEYNYEFIIVMTKCDKLNQSQKSKINKNLKETFKSIDDIDVVLTSTVEKTGLELLKNIIEMHVRG